MLLLLIDHGRRHRPLLELRTTVWPGVDLNCCLGVCLCETRSIANRMIGGIKNSVGCIRLTCGGSADALLGSGLGELLRRGVQRHHRVAHHAWAFLLDWLGSDGHSTSLEVLAST